MTKIPYSEAMIVWETTRSDEPYSGEIQMANINGPALRVVETDGA